MTANYSPLYKCECRTNVEINKETHETELIWCVHPSGHIGRHEGTTKAGGSWSWVDASYSEPTIFSRIDKVESKTTQFFSLVWDLESQIKGLKKEIRKLKKEATK